MKRALLLLCLLMAAGAQAQTYKWAEPDGKINYSDQPPPPTVRNVEAKHLGQGSVVDTAGLPLELAQTVQKHTVVLYTTSRCKPCNDARSFLSNRGIPFTEKTVTTAEDQQKLKQAGGSDSLPFLTIGRTTMQGYEPDSWGASLTAAGYPETSALPKGYQNPGPQSAGPATPTPSATPTPTETASPNPSPRHPKNATKNAPEPTPSTPGFRF